MLILILASVLVSTILVAHLRKMAPFYILSKKVPGPYAFPLIGSAWEFMNKNSEELMQTLIAISKKYPSPLRFWLGPKFVLIVHDCENARTILSSNRMNTKGDVYRFMEPLLGNGLITSSGARWREHRKMILPFMNSDFVNGALGQFLKFSENFLKDLEGMVDGKTFDVAVVIQKYVCDVLAMKILGYDIQARMGQNSAFLKAPKRFYEIVSHRISKPWLQPNKLFQLTNFYKEQQQLIEDMDIVIWKAIREAKNRLREKRLDENSPVIDKILNAMQENPEVMSEEELGYHLKTLFIASEDTIVNTSSLTLLCLGMNLKHQELIVNEMEGFLPSVDEHLIKCIKEILRLFPTGPFLFRETIDHFQLGELILPPKCTVLVSIWSIHRDPQQWEHSEEFYPWHFDKEAAEKRHPCSYIPFSMGPRRCIGKTLAYPWIKLIIAAVLKKFVVQTDGDIKSLKLQADVTIRAANGCNIRLEHRH